MRGAGPRSAGRSAARPAVEEFTEGGFERAGVAAIARRAGVTTGAIYSRWRGRQGSCSARSTWC
ncbi:MAG: helix-turn-helix domain-containing protein [Acidimicrobiales bacterium]